MRYLFVFVFYFFTFPLHAIEDWKSFVEDFQENPAKYPHSVIHGGASNINYRVVVDGKEYFLRICPKNTKELYADIEVEYQVLKLLSPLGCSITPVFFDKEKRVMVTEYIEHDHKKLSLQDPLLQQRLFAMLHQIEDSKIKIDREFKPYQDVVDLVEKAKKYHVQNFSDEFLNTLLPALQKIERVLQKNPKKTLCHLDLHSLNLLQKEKKLWIIDWEYAAMSHPFLVLASMASIERWDDEEMKKLLSAYLEKPTEEDFYTLYLYRIAADLFWAAWNHIQKDISPIVRPYGEWEELFMKAAQERINSKTYEEALFVLS